MFVLEKGDGELDPDARKEGGRVKTDSETGAMQVRPAIHLEPPEAGRAAGFSPGAFGGSVVCSPECERMNFCCFKPSAH